MSFELIDAGTEVSFTLEKDKKQCKNCKAEDDECDDMIDQSINLWDLDHVYKSSTGNCYAPEPLERWWITKKTDPATNLPANESSVRQVRRLLRQIQEREMLQKKVIKYFRFVCGWIPLMWMTTHSDREVNREEDGTVKLTFERVYFNGTHLESMTADDLLTTLETLRNVRELNPLFKMEDWMPLSEDIEKLSEEYHKMLDENVGGGIRVRFGVDLDNEKLPGVWLVK